MDNKAIMPTTQRAYTLRLRGAKKDDESWRDALWATHEAVNKGAKAIGITDNAVKYQLKRMQEKKLIRRVGPAKGGHWEVVK